ncbi:MAG: glycosyltransferase [Candidatus Altiarchaeota archaeon]
MMDFSVMIPVYNEEELLVENTGKLIKYLDKAKIGEYEVIVCSNGSTDRTVELGRVLEERYPGRFRFLFIPRRGVGYAFTKMVDAASSEKLVSLDMDLSSDLSFIKDCVSKLDDNSVVIGSKYLGKQERKAYRTFISGVFIQLVRALLGLDYRDYSIGTKGWVRSDILPYVKDIDHGSSYVIELVYHVKKDGGSVVEIPVFCNDTRGSKFNLVNEIFYRFKNLVSLWLKVR